MRSRQMRATGTQVQYGTMQARWQGEEIGDGVAGGGVTRCGWEVC